MSRPNRDGFFYRNFTSNFLLSEDGSRIIANSVRKEGVSMQNQESMIRELMELRFRVGKCARPLALKDYTKGEMFVLNFLSQNSGVFIPKDISMVMAISSARVAAILKSLESKGLIERIKNKDDHRQTLVRLLPEGKEVVSRTDRGLFRFIGDIMEQLGPEDSAEYLRLEKKIVGIIESRCQDSRTEDPEIR